MGGDYTRLEAHWLAGGCFAAALLVGAGIGVVVGRATSGGGMPDVPAVSSAQAAEEERPNLFALSDPRTACVRHDRAVAWKRDESFAVRLTVWCLGEREGVEGGEIVAWSQAEGQPFATREVVQRDFYPYRVLTDLEDQKPFVAACGGDGFLGWGKGGSYNEGGAVRRGDGEHVRITGFYGGLVWCVGDDLYALAEGVPDDGNPYDRRFDAARGVETPRAN